MKNRIHIKPKNPTTDFSANRRKTKKALENLTPEQLSKFLTTDLTGAKRYKKAPYGRRSVKKFENDYSSLSDWLEENSGVDNLYDINIDALTKFQENDPKTVKAIDVLKTIKS